MRKPFLLIIADRVKMPLSKEAEECDADRAHSCQNILTATMKRGHDKANFRTA